jgi:glucokinase
MGKTEYAICLDVGGTSIKSAIVDSHGNILEETYKILAINTQGTKEYIIGVFSSLISAYIDYLKFKGISPLGVGIGMCGPFDYEKGICLIPPHLHKYQSIYGLNLKAVLQNSTGIENIVFENDAWTYLRGEVWVGAAKGFNRVIGITLGTGFGSAFYCNGKIVTEGAGVPKDGWIGGVPFNNGIVEDYITRRWFLAKYAELVNSKDEIDVLRIAELANRGDKICQAIFNEMGERLGKVVAPYAEAFQAECIVFGGQISKSFSLFENPLKKELSHIKSLNKICKAAYIDKSAIFGAAKIVFKDKL